MIKDVNVNVRGEKYNKSTVVNGILTFLGMKVLGDDWLFIFYLPFI